MDDDIRLVLSERQEGPGWLVTSPHLNAFSCIERPDADFTETRKELLVFLNRTRTKWNHIIIGFSDPENLKRNRGGIVTIRATPKLG